MPSAAEQALGLPLVLKSRRLGYDGKGQAWAREPGSARAAWDAIGRAPAVAEAAVDFAAEFSVVLARSAAGDTAAWDVPLNHHEGGILRRSTVPAGAPIDALAPQATAIAAGLAEALGHIGVLTVEFFATAAGPGRQRDRAARPQQRPLDHRRRRHLAVRAAHPRDLRPAAGLDAPPRAAS